MTIFRSLQRILKSPKSPLRQITLVSQLSSPSPSPSPSPSSSPLADVTPEFISGPHLLPCPQFHLPHSPTPSLIENIEAFRVFESAKLSLPSRLAIVGISGGGGRDWKREKDNGGVGDVEKRGFGNGGGGGGLRGSFVNWPNFVSVSRMVSGPVLGWMIVNEWYLPAFAGLAISGASDWLDGYLARRMGINSVVGSYLDPLADKVLVGCVAVAMVKNNLLHPGLVGLVVLRDVMLIGGAVYKRASSLSWQWETWYDFFNLDGTRPEKVRPLFISKVNTVFQLILVAVALLQPEFGNSETQAYITYLSWLVASTTLASTASYGAQHIRNKSISVSKTR